MAAMRSTNGVSPDTAVQRKSDTEMEGRCSRVVRSWPNLALRAGRGNGQQHVEQGLAGGRPRALDRQQPALGDHPAMGDILSA